MKTVQPQNPQNVRFPGNGSPFIGKTSPRRPAKPRVVIEQLLFAKRSSRWDGFTLSQSSGTIGEILADCQRVAPCVLIVSQASLRKLNAKEFRATVGIEGLVQVLVLGTRKGPNLDLVEELLSIGCMGYLPHDVPRATLRRAVRAIASGQIWANRSIIAQVMKRMICRQQLGQLTLREREILRLIGSGLSNRAIADRLFIAQETVRWHIRGLYVKLGVGDRFSAIVYGKQLLDTERRTAPSEIPSIAAPPAKPEPMAPS